MNFFKSVFSDDPDPPSSPPSDPNSPTSQPSETLISDNSPSSQSPTNESSPKSPSSATAAAAGGWSFGGLIQTLSSRSESVIETYRRDLQEFTSGLKSETEVLKHVASSSLDISAAKAQVSLESVGRAVDVVWKSTAEIITHGKESLLAHDLDSAQSEYSPRSSGLSRDHSVGNLSSGNVNVRYSRFEAQLRGIQSDVNTYVEEVEDGKEEFEKWRLGFDLGEMEGEVEKVMGESDGVVEAIYKKVVPSVVDRETFWLRYFYRVHRLKQAEFVRAKLVKRAMKEEDEEELSWDVDDDESGDGEDGNANVKEDTKGNEDSNVKALAGNVASVALEGKREGKEEGKAQVVSSQEDDGKGNTVEEASQGVEEASQGVVKEDVKEHEKEVKVEVEEKGELKEEEEVVKKGDEKAEASESGKDSDISVVSSQQSHDEEDLGWDEIEDIGSGDEKNGTQLGSPDRAELRKRLSAAEDDEDLSWDIEDDDEPIKH